MTKPLRIALVGVGRWGTRWLELLAALPAVDVVALVDARPAALDAAGLQAGIARYTQLAQMVESEAPEAALVATSEGTHYDVAHELLTSGVHCLIEKPLALTARDASELAALAEQMGLQCQVSQNYRARAGAQAVRAAVASGLIGQVERTNIRFARRAFSAGPPHMLESSVFLESMGIHHLDLIRFVLDEDARTVVAHEANPSSSWFQNASTLSALIEMASGSLVTYDGRWSSHTNQSSWDGTWTIEGSHGSLSWCYQDVLVRSTTDLYSLYHPGVRETAAGLRVQLPTPQWEDRAATMMSFVESIRTSAALGHTAADNVGTIALLESARASIASRAITPVRVPFRATHNEV